MSINYYNPKTNERAIGKTGFSWWTLFLGFFVPMYRGHATAAIIMLVAALTTFGISHLVFPFFYNSWYRNWLYRKGFEEIREHRRMYEPADHQRV